MNVEEAVDKLSDGHAIITPDHARGICAVIGVEYSPRIEEQFFTDYDDPKGPRMKEGCEGSVGVAVVRLGGLICSNLGLNPEWYVGRGFQAREHARVIGNYLGTRKL